MGTVKSYDEISGAYLDYQAASIRTMKVSNTVSAISIVGKDDIGGVATGISKVKFGSNIKAIDDYCCYVPNDLSANAQLTSVVESDAALIYDHAFQNCTKLTSYGRFNAGSGNNAPSVVYTVGNYAFANTGLKSVHLNLQHDGKTIPNYNYQGCVLTDKAHGPYAGYYSFANCKQLKDVTFYKSTEIGSHMFDGCTSLTGVYFSKNNSAINDISGSCVGEYSFANCTSLSSIEFPKRFEIIANNMFENCTSLSQIKFNGTSADANSDHLIGINEYAFKNTPKLTELSIPASVTHIELFSPDCLAGSSISAVYLYGMLSSAFSDFYMLSSKTTTKSITNTTTLTGDFKVGTMYQNKFDEIAAEARKTHIPVVLWFCGKNCGRCVNFKNKVASTDEFKNWVANTPYYFVHGDNHDPQGYGVKFWDKIKWDYEEHLFVIYGLLWYKPDGTTVAHGLRSMNGSSTDLSYIKAQCEKYFKGYEYKDMTLTSTKEVTTTEEFIVTNAEFNGWGVGHKCDFYTADGMVFHYDPDTKLSALTDGKRMRMAGDLVTITFTLHGKDGTDMSVAMTVNSTTKIEDFAPNMYFLGAASRNDPATKATDTGQTNLCGKVYNYDIYQFTGWGVATDSIAQATKTLTAQYIHTVDRTSCRLVFYDNLGNSIVQKVGEKGVISTFPDNIEYQVPSDSDLDELQYKYLINDSLSAAYTNIHDLYGSSVKSDGDDEADSTQAAPLPELVAWIELGLYSNYKISTKIIKPTGAPIGKCLKVRDNFVRIFIPWYSNYYSGEGSDECIQVSKRADGSTKVKIKSDAKIKLRNYICYDKATKSIGIKQKVGGEFKLIAYYCIGQFFPCKLHKDAGQIAVDNLAVNTLLSKTINDNNAR